MSDLLLVLLGAGSIGLCAVYARGCERLLGPDPDGADPLSPSGSHDSGETAGHRPETGSR